MDFGNLGVVTVVHYIRFMVCLNRRQRTAFEIPLRNTFERI